MKPIEKEIAAFTQTAVDSIKEVVARLKAAFVKDLVQTMWAGSAETAADRIYRLVEKYGTKEDCDKLLKSITEMPEKRHCSQIHGWQLEKCTGIWKDYQIPVYSFSGGTAAATMLKIIDMVGKNRMFRITLNDEEGVITCRKVKDSLCASRTTN